MGLLSLYMGKVTPVRKKLVSSPVFLKLVRPLVFRDPASAENRVQGVELVCEQKSSLLRKNQLVSQYACQFGWGL